MTELAGQARNPARVRAFEGVLARIEERIAADGLTVGDRLPGERQLAEQLQVSRSSVREALRVLESLGVVSSQVGRGPDAGAVLTSRPGSALTGLLRLHLGLATLSLREVVDTRLMIEQWSAGHAARSRAGLETMERAIAAMDAARGPEEFVEHDIAFHAAIAEASGNRLTSAIMQALRGAVQRFAIDAVVRLGDTGGLQADHRRIRDAIRDGDAATAVEAIAVHLERAYPSTAGPAS
ncbi:FadR/GntR family transcriptional regulator [Planotetraspora kaengkrachanensis]|uniref:GntR family transcriptional regulator n=1 Tax=Planotetraspora kaengkrachanensis TaxID=575193 RepID=A0A8J3PW89_9ACTN|nr:FCD domain-containing protein [Planotetraspora kaengkrachanensis]GIG82223.1 GntR family transcriptional regulator [Planotetraspora kaengkrachanensis]